MKQLLLLFLLGVSSLLISCGSDDDDSSIVGKWEVTKFTEVNCDDDDDNVSFDFSDGNCFEEDGFDPQNVLIRFSKNGQLSWDSTVLEESIEFPGLWQGNIPSTTSGTTVFWYIYTVDRSGNVAMKYNAHGHPYHYTVINRPPTVQIISPNGGEEYNDTLTIRWQGQDLDFDSMTYTLAYEREGMGWFVIATNITKMSYFWNMSDYSWHYRVSLTIHVPWTGNYLALFDAGIAGPVP